MKDITQYNNISRYLAVLVLMVAISFTSQAQDGEALFTTHCKACHTTTGQRMVGPGMKGVSQKRTKEWLKSWITNSSAMIAAGDADAIAIFEEYSKIPMNSFEHLDPTEIDAMIDYLISLDGAAPTEGKADVKEEAPAPKVEFSSENVEAGKLLFTGATRFENGGASCLTCHNVDNAELIAGGELAKDLTQVYSRIGEAGLSGILGTPPFPAMATAYSNNKLTEEEILNLTAFFKSVDVATPVESSGKGILWYGFIGLFIWLGVVYLLWSGRKKESVKESIFKRQLKPIN